MKKFIIPGIAILTAVSGHSAVLYDLSDTVLDGDTGANTFFVANSQSSPAGLNYSGAGPTLVDTFGSSGNYSYFVANFDPETLSNPGDSITLSYNLTPSSTTTFSTNAGSFRVGLFNSNGTRITTNSTGNGDASFHNDTGYVAHYHPRGSSGGTFLERSGTTSGGDNNILWYSGRHSSVSGTPTLASPGTGAIDGAFTLTLVATGIQITSVINGGAAQTVIDTSDLVSTFDSFSIFGISGTTNPTLTFSELTVSTIPEPSSSMLLGLTGIAFLSLRRRQSLFARG